MVFDLSDKVRNFYGETDYTIAEGALNEKGKFVVERSLFTNWQKRYYYVEGFIKMRVDGRKVRSLAKLKNLTVEEL